MNTPSLKTALVGAAGGATLGAALVFALASLGFFPGANNPARIHDYLMAHPEIITDMTNRLQDIQQAAQDKALASAMKKIGLKAFFDPKIAFVTGPADAKKTLVEFYDYDCPYCRASLSAVQNYYAAHKNDTRFAFIEYPLPSLHGPSATLAAQVSLAARRQPDRYLPFHFTLMSEEGTLTDEIIFADAAKAGLDVAKLKADMQNADIQQAIDASAALAHEALIDGTPTFVIDGVIHPGAVDDATLTAFTKS